MSRRAARSPFLPWRYGLFLLVFASAIPASLALGWAMGVLISFDVAALAFIATMKPLFGHGAEQMRAHARANDANRTLILVLTAIVMLAILVAVASELSFAGAPGRAMLGLIIATLVLAWTFSNLVYTVHYAFLFYSGADGGGDRKGLGFPDRTEPDYWDFAYFAFTLGMTFQTSDVEIGDPAIRKVALFHSLAAFVFNLGVIAFSINILGGG